MLRALLVLLTVKLCEGNEQSCGLYFDKQYGGFFADCTGRKLQQVPNYLPGNITALDISGNDLTIVQNNTFYKYNKLIYLNMNMNLLSKFEPRAFSGLFNLTTLLLARNKLRDDKVSFPDELFQDLMSLQTLNIEQNEMSSYPDWVFLPLVNLHSLYIDSVPAPLFGPGFSKLANLKLLQMDSRFLYGGICSTTQLTNETFQSLNETKLEVLILNFCSDLSQCESGVLEPLIFLKHLELTHNRIGIHNVLHLLHPFAKQNMKRILFNHTQKFKMQDEKDIVDRVLTKQSMRYLTKICVTEVSLRSNQLYLIEFPSIYPDPFEGCLKKIDLSENYIIGDVGIFFFLFRFTELEYLDVSFQRQDDDLQRSSTLNGSSSIAVTLPQNLIYFGFSGSIAVANSVQEIIFQNTHKLETVMFASNLLSGLMKVRGLETVSNVDLSGNKFEDVFDFHSFANAKRLSLRNCKLHFPLEPFSAHSIFSVMKFVEYLDVSMNQLRFIQLLLLSDTIVHLNLSHNEFESIPIETLDYPRLIHIDLSFNLIGYLDKDTRSKLDLSAEKNNLKLIVQGNTFSCSCENLDFILWLMDTPVIYESDRNFACLLYNGTMTRTVDVAHNYKSLNHYCTGKLTLSLSVTFMVVIFTSISASYMVSKNPVRYRNALMRIFGLGIKYLTPKDFAFTFYIGYCDADIPFVYRKLRPALELCNSPVRLFLKDRDVLPGVVIADGIICGITNSWKSVLVISDDFLEDLSQWSQFTLDAALYSLSDLIPSRIIVLLVGAVQVEDLPESLLNVVEEECILRVEDYQDGDETLWKDLRKTAGV
ncbi:toll-like receptor 4 isoform X1 [Haliotis rufescens]|uniref:toll-like receptor 4 isoform X1 n=1 Tax=Haliotis rufescens TaxID=6454 RepID=UPI00201F0C9A|nr:toll-like receptor 4 isoform X1 [Haliotis rufescens]XP_046325590.2 toll-like receptor 4 isoform X1 [Haliotis rufescens]